MNGAITVYAQEQALGFQPLPEVPKDEHSEYISYIFVYFTGESWAAELLIDPMYLDVVDPAWTALVNELNSHVLFYFSQNDMIGGYYPICTSQDPVFASQSPCWRLVKKTGLFENDVLIPDLSTNLDRICLNRIGNMTEINEVLAFLGLPSDIPAALQDDMFAMFAYLSQLAILKVLPFEQSSQIAPYVLDSDGKLSFHQGSRITCPNSFATFMNEFFFANVYDGYQYLTGEYPLTTLDVHESRQRTIESVDSGNDVFVDPNVESCFSKFFLSQNTEHEKTYFIETWCNAVVKRCYLIALLKTIAYNKAVSLATMNTI